MPPRLFRSTALALMGAAVCALAPEGARGAGGVPILSPTQDWGVESGALEAAAGERLSYCSISNHYGEDSRLEFYGTGGRLAAIKIDIPEKDLTPGEVYEAQLSVPGPYQKAAPGAAVDEKTIMLNVRADGDLSGALNNGSILYVNLKERTYAFSLSGIKNFEARMRACRVDVPAVREARVWSAPAGHMAQDAGVQEAAEAGRAILQDSGNAGAPRGFEQHVEPEKPPVQDVAADAKKEDRPQPGDEPAALVQRQRVVPTVAESRQPDPGIPASTETQVGDPIERGVAAKANADLRHIPPPEWMAQKGADMREVLDLWSGQKGVEVIWNTDDDFAVRETMQLRTSYEAAVERLLSQYGDVRQGLSRPVGRLHIDEQTGRQVLVIQSERVL